jgi:two-component system LytT family sensor kinase
MKYKWIKYHVVFFVITWIFNYAFNFYLKVPDGKLLPYTIFFVFDNAILIGSFYGMMYVSQFFLKKMIYFISFLLISIVIGGPILSIGPYFFYILQGAPTDFSHVYFIKMFELSYIKFSSIGFLFLQKWDESTTQKVQLIESHSDAELTFLRSQMSPHFLLNTLNSIYSLALNKSPETYAAISELKTIYSYIQKNEGKVSLKSETKYLENFIKIQKRRFGDAVSLNVDFTIDQDYQIEPFLLSSFIENAFKHGVSMREFSYIKIRLLVSKGMLEYVVDNSDHSDYSSKRKDSTSGIGLQNLSRRLELLYPKRFYLKYFREGKAFTSLLMIKQL